MTLTPVTNFCPGDCGNENTSIVSDPPDLSMPGDATSDTAKHVQAAIDTGNKNYLAPLQQLTISNSGEVNWVSKPIFCPMIPNF